MRAKSKIIIACILFATTTLNLFSPESVYAKSIVLMEQKEIADDTRPETASIDLHLTSPSFVLMEATTGKVILEKNENEARSPASITKIMTLILIFDALEQKQINLSDEVVTSAYAKSMGGSQVFLEEGEIQSVDTLIKCIAVASGNDASVAMAEYISGTEEAFVDKMNKKAQELNLTSTHFVDCCGLTSSDNHYTSALDVAKMSRYLITNHPEIYDYTKIWMEDITHVTKKGESTFTLSSTNKLLKQYPWTTGLKTGSTKKAGYCFCATANKNDISLIAVVMAAPDFKVRFQEAKTLLEYGYQNCKLYNDTEHQVFTPILVNEGVSDRAAVEKEKEFCYLDTEGLQGELKKEVNMFTSLQAPVEKGTKAGEILYKIGEKEIGKINIITTESVEKAKLLDYLKKIFYKMLI